jgi:hypothetical protein
MPGPFYFAWVADSVPFDPVAHAVEDEAIVELSIAQQEGEFAALQITVLNPYHGLLAPGRLPWCWLSWDKPAPAEAGGTALVPLFCGRLTGVPEAIDGETVRLLFTARPTGYESLRDALAATLKVLPYFDPVWVTGDTEDADNVLEAYGARWHIDRTTLDVTVSDELIGEDGTLTFGEADHLYDGLSIGYAGPPLSQVNIEGTLAWTQGGSGTIDLTERIYNEFQKHNSLIVAHPKSGIITSMTGEGLASDWPEGGDSLDGGWTVNDATYCEELSDRLYTRYDYHVTYQAYTAGINTRADEAVEEVGEDNLSNSWFRSDDWWYVDFPVYNLKQETKFNWTAERSRIETIKCTLTADIQPVLAEPLLDDYIGKIEVNASDTVTEPDAVTGVMPIGDVRRKSYLDTDRGTSSVEYLLLLARAQLRRSARAVEVECRLPWEKGVVATLRHNAQIVDYRLPGGEAFGKVTAYEMSASGSGEHTVSLTIGCAIGYGGTVAGQAGEPAWVEDGYVATGYQVMTGATIVAPTGDIAYQALGDFEITDDGVDLLTLDEFTGVESLEVINGLKEQANVIDAADPLEAMTQLATQICVQLVPLTDQEFETVFTPTVEPMPIPQTINLEAA